MIVKTFSGKISCLVTLDNQHSKMELFFIFLLATLKDSLMTRNISETLRDEKIRNWRETMNIPPLSYGSPPTPGF